MFSFQSLQSLPRVSWDRAGAADGLQSSVVRSQGAGEVVGVQRGGRRAKKNLGEGREVTRACSFC